MNAENEESENVTEGLAKEIDASEDEIEDLATAADVSEAVGL